MINSSFITKNRVFFANDLLFIINQQAHHILFQKDDTIIIRYGHNMNYVFNIISCDEYEMTLEGRIDDTETKREHRVVIQLVKDIDSYMEITIYDDNKKIWVDGEQRSQLLDSYRITDYTLDIVDVKRHDRISIEEILTRLKQRTVTNKRDNAMYF